MRSCTVERARLSFRASDATGSRALALRSAIKRLSESRIGKTPEILSIRRIVAQFPALCRLPSGRNQGYLNGAVRNGSGIMKNVALVGGGKIGVAIAELLGGSGDYRVTVFDHDEASLER